MINHKKPVFSSKLIRTFFIFAFIQILIFLLFICMFGESKTIDLQKTKQLNITVDEIYITRVILEYRLVICSNSTKYLFTSRGTLEEYSVSDLYETISVGDQLSILYYEKNSILGRNNLVVDARTGTKIFRSFEKYNKGKEGLAVTVIIMFSIIELFFCVVSFVYIWSKSNLLKRLTKLKFKRKK